MPICIVVFCHEFLNVTLIIIILFELIIQKSILIILNKKPEKLFQSM